MSTTELEQEIAGIKKRVERLEKTQDDKPRQTWREAFGAMKADPLLREAAHLGTQWRAAENLRK